MKKFCLVFLLIFFSGPNILQAQTSNSDLNKSLDALRKCIFNEDYEQLAKYTHPEIIKMMGGKAKMIETTKSSIKKMREDGFSYESLGFKNPSLLIKNGDEIQFTITQEIGMRTPQNRILAEYSIIGISYDNGKNWVFIDTSGKSKDTMRKFLPFLSEDLVIKPKSQRIIEEDEM